MRVIRIILSFVAAALLPITATSADGTLLKGRDVTEENLLRALTPEQPMRTRSIRITADDAPARAASGKKASALLLITFETNSAALTANSKEQLSAVGAALRNDRLRDYRFEIEGHADPRGSAVANQLLSQQRAESVRHYLIDAQRVAADRLQAIGKGASEPIDLSNIAAAENRRVTITTLTR